MAFAVRRGYPSAASRKQLRVRREIEKFTHPDQFDDN
jgi:hypothetical protein